MVSYVAYWLVAISVSYYKSRERQRLMVMVFHWDAIWPEYYCHIHLPISICLKLLLYAPKCYSSRCHVLQILKTLTLLLANANISVIMLTVTLPLRVEIGSRITGWVSHPVALSCSLSEPELLPEQPDRSPHCSPLISPFTSRLALAFRVLRW